MYDNISTTPGNSSAMMSSTALPIIIIIAIYMAVGLFGNVMVILYYGFKVKPNPSFMFITVMAISDITVCSVSMPLEILDFSSEHESLTNETCKILRFTNYLAACSSSIFLLIIAVDRYKNLCQPLGTQISIHAAKILILVGFVFSVALASPYLAFWGVFELNPTSSNQEDRLNMTNITDIVRIIKHDCMINKKYDLPVTIYTGVFFLLFLIAVLSLALLYYRVVKEVVTMEKFRKKRKSIKKKNNHTSKEGIEENDKTPKLVSYRPYNSVKKSSHTQDKTDNPNKPHKNMEEHQIHTMKLTMIAVSITIAFVVSYMPHLCLMVWIKVTDGFQNLSGASLVVFDIFLRSWLLNSIVNPIIYGFFNEYFRQFVYSLFCKTLRKDAKTSVPNV